MTRARCTLLLCVLFWASPALAAIHNFLGFETGDGSELAIFTLTGTGSFVTTPVRTGTYALRINPTTTGTGSAHVTSMTAGTVGLASAWDLADVWVEFQFRVAVAPAASDEPIFECQTSPSATKLEVRLNSARQVVAYNSALTLLATGTTALTLDTWYRIGIRCGTGASGTWSVSINGTSEISGTGDLTTSNSARARLGKNANRNGQTVDFFYDDVVVDSAQLLGNVEVKIAIPTSNGSTMQWTAGTGASNYLEVDEIPTDTADYVQSVAQNDVALFDVQDTGTIGVSGTIHAVTALVRRLEAVAGTGAFSVRLRSNVTNSDSGAVNPGVVLTGVRLLTTDPDTAAAWTTGGVDGVEVGGIETSADETVRISSAFASVLYTPAAGGAPTPRGLLLGVLP